MTLNFNKYQANGNDFIIFNNFSKNLPKEQAFIKKLCSRKFNVGADGVIFVENCKSYDFEMLYFNSDGKPGSLCGNGARCCAKFAFDQGLIKNITNFKANDGVHHCIIEDDIVHLSMNDIEKIECHENDIILDSGSPHYIKIVDNVEKMNVLKIGQEIRNSEYFKKDGINVNFVEIVSKKEFKIRTYERGVENETLSCGTGATAVAIAMHFLNKTTSEKIEIISIGGKLSVKFKKYKNSYNQIFLVGEAKKVYSGEINYK